MLSLLVKKCRPSISSHFQAVVSENVLKKIFYFLVVLPISSALATKIVAEWHNAKD